MTFERILTLDLAAKTGWAFYDASDGTIQSSHVSFASETRQWGVFLDEFAHWLEPKLAELRPGLVVIEQPHFRGTSTFHLTGMFGVANMYAYRAGANQFSVHSATLQSHALGSGDQQYKLKTRAEEQLRAEGCTEKQIRSRMGKVAVMLSVGDRGYEVRTDDEADAVNMLDYVLAQQRRGKL